MGTLTGGLASAFGVDVNAIILILGILSTYPVNLAYILLIRNLNVAYRSAYFLISGFTILTLAYGISSIHYLINCCVCYLALKCFSRSIALAINFVFTFAYLLYGYSLTQIDSSYVITWTMPGCVLTLRLISITFDLYDGNQNEKNKKDGGRHKESAILNVPPFHLFLSYCYFPGTLLVGPLIPYVSYFTFLSKTAFNRKVIRISLIRLLGGLFFLFVYFYGSIYWPIDYLRSQAFEVSGIWWKLTAMTIIAKIYMYKFVSVWLMTESSCILSGITSDGINFYRHTNVNLTKYEFAHSCTTIIGSYNMSTNEFAFKYVYRRLKFMGNIHLSKLITLIFLSIWHGFASGYYFAFSTEFLLLYFEKHFAVCFQEFQERHSLNVDNLKPFIWILGRIYTYYFIGYAFVSFMFLFTELWYPILSSVYFVGHLLLLAYIMISASISKVMRYL